MKRVILNRTWTDGLSRRLDPATGTDRMTAVVTVTPETQTELVTCNGAVILVLQYPAGTAYAARRLEKLAA